MEEGRSGEARKRGVMSGDGPRDIVRVRGTIRGRWIGDADADVTADAVLDGVVDVVVAADAATAAESAAVPVAAVAVAASAASLVAFHSSVASFRVVGVHGLIRRVSGAGDARFSSAGNSVCCEAAPKQRRHEVGRHNWRDQKQHDKRGITSCHRIASHRIAHIAKHDITPHHRIGMKNII